MKRLPQRPRNQVLETESQKFVKSILPSEWIVTDILNDYGIDLDVEIVEQTYVSGAHFSMQLKSTDKMKITKSGFVSYHCNVSTLRYFLEKTEQVVFLVYDAKNKIGYWIWVKDYITNELMKNKKWKRQTTATIKIPKTNIFEHKSVGQIKTRVMKNHKQAKLLSTIQTLNNPYIHYDLQIDGNKEIITMSPKYPGVEHDYPLTFNFKFNFGNSTDGQQSHQSLQNAIKKGLPTLIDSKFIESVEFPELLDPEIFGHDEFKPDGLYIFPVAQNREFSATVTILDQKAETLFQIPFVEFKEKRYGSEEIVFSNDTQQIPIKFSIILNHVERNANISFNTKFLNLNVFQALETLKFQRAIATGSWLHITHASTNTSLIKSEIPKGIISQPSEILLDVASNLSHIQERTGQIIPWPEKISYDEKDLIDELTIILDTGIANGGNRISFSLEKVVAQTLLPSLLKNGHYNFRLEANERFAHLFGQKIILGPVSIMIMTAKPNEETVNNLANLSNLPDDALVQIDLEVDDPGIKIYHHRWLPSHMKDFLNLKTDEKQVDSSG